MNSISKLQIFCLSLLLITSCGSKPESDAQAIDEELSEIVESGEYKENGLMKLRSAESILDTREGIHAVATLVPDESLPRVANDNFGTYCDNRAQVLAVSAAGDTIVSRRFAKADLNEQLDDLLRSSAILDGLTLKNAGAAGVQLEASVSVPHSDEQAAFTITLGRDGSLSAQRNAPADDSFADDGED